MKKAINASLKGALGGCVAMNVFLLYEAAFGMRYEGLLSPFQDMFGDGAIAAFIQLAAFVIIGVGIALCGFVRKQERMGLFVQTICQYVFLGIGFFPFGFIMKMIPQSGTGILAYAGILFLLYVVIWAAQMADLKNKLNEMNAEVKGEKYRGKSQIVPDLIMVFGMFYVFPAIFFLIEKEFIGAVYVTNLMNYFVYPFLLLILGIRCGVHAGASIWYPVGTAILIVPISLLLYQDIRYTGMLFVTFGIIAGVSNLIGAAIKKWSCNSDE